MSFCTLATAGTASSRVSLGRGSVALHAMAHLPSALSGYVLVLHAHRVISSASVNCALLLLSHSSSPCVSPHGLVTFS